MKKVKHFYCNFRVHRAIYTFYCKLEINIFKKLDRVSGFTKMI